MIELLCTLTGIIAGVAIVASLLHQREGRQQFEAKPVNSGTDRILGIADQLQVISHRVAADVTAHSEKVVHISDRLANPEKPEQILSTITEIISANQSMQGQLADAQKRIAQQSRMIEQASHQARTDALTGLCNRRALDEFLSNCLNNYNEDEFVGLLLMDIDHFKSFNDSFGHTTGDAVLASFARSITSCCGEECYAARFGGEEFAVILTGSSIDDLAEKAAEVRYFISEQVISYEDLQLKITSSAGLCRLMKDDTANQVYERADEGLYQSKKAGRNCGHYLGEHGWLPFPEREGTPKTLADLRSEAALSSAAQNAALGSPVVSEAPRTPASHNSTVPPQLSPSSDARSAEQTLEAAVSDGTEILDLKSFLGRLDAFLEQLRKAELPAAAVMVEAIGLAKGDVSESLPVWDKAVEIVQQNLRGIDLVCLYRPFTLCLFMPGCSLDASVDRAAKIQTALREAAETWDGTTPEKFAVAIGSVATGEENAGFLNRLESALEEALDAGPTELVVHNGQSCHFQSV
jgi:diguanylate cyclase (GGDEF)-like protein